MRSHLDSPQSQAALWTLHVIHHTKAEAPLALLMVECHKILRRCLVIQTDGVIFPALTDRLANAPATLASMYGYLGGKVSLRSW